MELMSTNCPNCNSFQQFPVKSRREGTIKVSFVACNMCKEELILQIATPKQDRERRKIVRNRVKRIMERE